MSSKNKGVRPEDVIVLVKIFLKRDIQWRVMDLAYELELSIWEVSNALERL